MSDTKADPRGSLTCKDVRIALGAVAPVPMRAIKTEEMLLGKKLTQKLIEMAGIQASKESKPITDMRASAAYRKKMVAVLTQSSLDEAVRAVSKN